MVSRIEMALWLVDDDEPGFYERSGEGRNTGQTVPRAEEDAMCSGILKLCSLRLEINSMSSLELL